MAIEIKELVIKMTVQEKQPERTEPAHLDTAAKNKIIQECVEKVLKKIKYKVER